MCWTSHSLLQEGLGFSEPTLLQAALNCVQEGGGTEDVKSKCAWWGNSIHKSILRRKSSFCAPGKTTNRWLFLPILHTMNNKLVVGLYQGRQEMIADVINCRSGDLVDYNIWWIYCLRWYKLGSGSYERSNQNIQIKEEDAYHSRGPTISLSCLCFDLLIPLVTRSCFGNGCHCNELVLNVFVQIVLVHALV